MKEYQIQIKLINYLKQKKLSKLRFFHIPNQGVRSIKYKMLLAKMGMKDAKRKSNCDKACGAFVFLGVALIAVSSVLKSSN